MHLPGHVMPMVGRRRVSLPCRFAGPMRRGEPVADDQSLARLPESTLNRAISRQAPMNATKSE